MMLMNGYVKNISILFMKKYNVSKIKTLFFLDLFYLFVYNNDIFTKEVIY